MEQHPAPPASGLRLPAAGLHARDRGPVLLIRGLLLTPVLHAACIRDPVQAGCADSLDLGESSYAQVLADDLDGNGRLDLLVATTNGEGSTQSCLHNSRPGTLGWIVLGAPCALLYMCAFETSPICQVAP